MAYFYLQQQWYVLPNIAEGLQGNNDSGRRNFGRAPSFQRQNSFFPVQHFRPAHRSFHHQAVRHQFVRSHERYFHVMENTNEALQGGESGDVAQVQHTNRQDSGLSMNELAAALPTHGATQHYPSQHFNPSQDQHLSHTQQFATSTQPPNLQNQYNANYATQMSSYDYSNQIQRFPTASMQPQYHSQQMYQGQQPVYYQQYPHSGQYYQGSNMPESMLNRGYQASMGQGMSPTWNAFPSDPLSPQLPQGRAIPSAPRGPPRKPKQSGHALWVGNLPPGTLVTDLKDHFSRDATNDIESVFLISKSNCAFVNYKTAESCSAAMARFHDSRFSGVRLVCRLRRTSIAPVSAGPVATTPTAPTAPAVLSPTIPSAESQTAIEAITRNREESSKADVAYKSIAGADKINDKYFVVKSLTIEDLELSVRNGIWATQAHNEDALNKAYESVDNVYLIFSANKSGEYFGYARMASSINEESAAALEWKPRVEEAVIDDPDLPRSIPTPATETAPKGRIIDDSARGTMFWEADAVSGDEAEETESQAGDNVESTDPSPGPEGDDKSPAGDNTGPSQQPYGHPFRIEWISTARLPFYRTRGLKNAWNSNREVKIARDGTELETGVGRRLISMFSTVQGGRMPFGGLQYAPSQNQSHSTQQHSSHPQHYTGQQQQHFQQQRYPPRPGG